MFKIESYITPIIINYIDKYVKDFRPQNAQVSLWGGEVTFQNLDIRLDVLQEELRLPLNIVSGHIHELTIRIPWTKIASESIQINVNTIEFAVKLNSDDSEKKEKDPAKISPTSTIQEPPGYMASLINKIANNISIKLNNIIFKYIEDDIVLSMNIQMLSIDSADENWNSAFIDINPVKVVLKKVININDLTICLDKRNAQGKIEVCQEPILYRCSLQARMIRRYNLSTAHLDSNTRIDIFTDNIDFKISVQQFPMLVRIYLLIRMLRDFYANVNSSKRVGLETTMGSAQALDALDGSYTTWIWNMLPEIFPNSIEEERLETHGHIFHNGFYAKNINITLKSQEIVSNSIIQTNTIYKYHPILKIMLSGVSFDTVSVGKKWSNLKGGISYIGIFPLENCTCGKKHNLTTIFVSGRKIRGDDDDDMFLSDSLKDPNCCENQNQNRLYENDFQSHIQLNTEDVLMNRCPAFAIDIVNYRQIMDDTKSYGSHSLSSREHDTVTEEYFMRIICGKFDLKIDSSLVHLYRTLNDHYEQYTYTAPYLLTNTSDILSQLTPPSTEDYESLLDCIPLRKTCIYFNSSTIEYYHLNDDHFQTNESNEFKLMPYFLINLNRAEFGFTAPLYPDKLINTTCQLPDPTEKLKENCFNRIEAFIDQLAVDTIFDKQQFNIFSLSNGRLSYDTLIQPELWKITKMPSYTFKIVMIEFRLTFNKPQLMLLSQLFGCGLTSSIPAKNLKAFRSANICHGDLSKLEIYFANSQASVVAIDGVLGIRSSIGMIVGLAYLPSSLMIEQPNRFKSIFISNETFDTNLINITVQYPIDNKVLKHPPIVNIEMQKTILNFDLLFQQFLNYNLQLDHGIENPHHIEEKAQKKVRKSSKISRPLLRTESVHSNSITTMSIVTSTNKVKEQENKQQMARWYEMIKQTIICIDLKSFTIVCLDKTLYLSQDGNCTSLKFNIENAKNTTMTIFRLPNLALQSTKLKNVQSCLKDNFPIDLSENWMLNIASFPWNIELNEFNCETIANNHSKVFLPNVNTKLTLDLSGKGKENEINNEEMSFVIHLDTTPIRLNVDLAQVKQINDSLASIMKIIRRPEKKQLNPFVEVPTSFYDTQINDFICETTNSEKSSEEFVSNADRNVSKIHCLMQWTITKFTLSILNSENVDDIELLFEIEDIIMSVDKQNTYTKAKTKFGSMNGVRKKCNKKTGELDILNIISRSNVLTTESQETFFEIVATTAMAANVHSRWGATTKKAMGFRGENDTITEITITMQSIDLKLELDVITVILAISNRIHVESTMKNDDGDGFDDAMNVCSVKDLPLLFFECKGLQLWLPNNNKELPDKTDVVIVKVNAISIVPSVENPILRKPVREDIYVKAAQLRMINTPGSIIEDRQYELMLKKVSIVTGNWNEILQFTYPANNENPAFDWNNQTEKPSLNVNTIFNDFVVSIVYAPAIIFQNIIVCGQAVELNCISDLAINLTLNDIILLNDLRCKFSSAFGKNRSTRSNSEARKSSKLRENNKMRTFADQFDNHFSDSGFKSHCNQDKSKINDKLDIPKREIPYVWSFVGGTFTLKLFENSSATEHEATPLLSMQLKQPNMISIQDSIEKTERFSLFNLTISLYEHETFEKKSNEFGNTVFDTHHGELDDTGIPPTLFEWKQIQCRSTNFTKIQCNMRKPIQAQFTPNNVEKLLCLNERMHQIFNVKSTPATDTRPIIQFNKIKEIRKLIGDANSIEFNLTKISINFMTSMDRLLSIALFKWTNKITVQSHPEQIMFATSTNSLVVNTQNFMLLNPTSLSIDFVLSQEKWNNRLLILANFTSNRIHLQINPYDFWTFAKIQLDFWSCLTRHENFNEKTDTNTQTASQRICVDNLKAYNLPKHQNDNQSNEEYFQDDLRLGTFEYIVTNADNALPLPYQIYLLNHNPDMQICWRYPHPRNINFIQIYPIPGQIDVTVKCRLEYFQESHNTFFPYILFEIGNKKVNEVKLPKQKLTAAIWRIVIVEPIASLIDIDVDEMSPIHDIFTPRTIISCIRIDSVFNIDNVPKLQANIRVNELKLSVFDSVNCVTLSRPDILSRYTLKVEEGTDVTHEFCEINFGEINVNVNIYRELKVNLYNEFTFGVKIFDASYLTMIPLIDKFTIGSYIELNKDNRPNVLHLTADKLSIRYGPAAGYAFSTMKNVWKDTSINIQKPIMSRFIICNASSVSLKFGQEFTDETIWLRSDECFYYGFRTQRSIQRLKFSVKLENNIVDVIETYPVNELDEMKSLKVATNKFLLITTNKLSTTQKQIIIKGQIELMNMTMESFQVQYKDRNKLQDIETDASNNSSSVILLRPSSSGSFFEMCDDSCNGYIRLNLLNNGWSGEIPLKRSTPNIPWLVKVPIKTDQKFVTFSVRIHSEYFDGTAPLNLQPKRILIVIWPFFTVRSLMPTNLNIIDREMERKYEVKGRGGSIDLQIAGTFETEHEFAFENEEIIKLILTYKNIDKRTFFSIPIQFKNIDDIIKELEKPDELKWPCSSEKEMCVDRKCSSYAPVAPLYKFSTGRTLSCAMRLDITPSCFFVNSLGFDITIVDVKTDLECSIQSSHIAIPMAISAGFALKFMINSDTCTTSTITLSDEKHSMRRAAVYLPESGCIQIAEKYLNNHVLRICLTSVNENSTRIISIQPLYVLCNFSKYQLNFHAFCIHRNEVMKYDDVVKIILEKSSSKSIPNNSQTTDNIFKGCDCSIFCDISRKTQKTSNYSKDFNFYMIIQHDDGTLSSPILLNKTIVRTAFGIRSKQKNISLAASITQYKEQYFVSIYNDRYPFVEIENRTNIEIFAAEADFADFSKSLKPKRSIHDDNFQWHCSIPPFSRMNYSPPSINERFPEKQNINLHLIFGCGNSKLLPGGNIQWSIPVEINKMDEKYLALPLYGDIKLTTFIINKTVKIQLEHIDFKKEFNVKVVHNKLSSPTERSNIIAAENISDDVEQKLHPVNSIKVDAAQPVTFSNFNTNIFIKGIVLVLYDDDKNSLYKKNNIVSLFLDDVITCYTEEERKFEFGFKNIQIDNNLYTSGKYDFPVILCSQSDKGTLETTDDKATIMPTPFSLPLMRNELFENQIGHFKILLENSEFSAKEVVCSIQPLRVYIEDKFIAILLDFAIENLPSNIIYTPNNNERVECAAGEILLPKYITEQVLSFLSEPLRLNRICIKPLSILISVHTCMRMYIALDHSPLHFAQFEYKNIYTTTMRLGYNIGMHYVSDALFGAGWVVGSLEILGSPSGLARSVSSGLWDFVSMPVQGLMRGPWGVLLGITYGSASLIKNVTAGTVNSVTKLAASVARNLDRLTLDDEHLERTEALRRVRPMGITHGISQGLTGFGINLLGAVGGIARHALEAKSSVEVFTGLGKGIIGVVTKPISGAAELLALTGQGVLHTVGFNAMPIAHDIQIHDDHSFPLSMTKVAWKILSKIDDIDSVLVIASAKHVESAEKTIDVTVAITSKLILLISDSSNELATVLSISCTRAIVDTKDPTRLILAMKSDDESQQFHQRRILQYLSKTHIQAENRLSFEEDIQLNFINESKQNILICKDAQIISYLAKYLQFLYYCLNTSK